MRLFPSCLSPHAIAPWLAIAIAAASAPALAGETLRFVAESEPGTLDPISRPDGDQTRMNRLIFDTLVRFNRGELEWRVAESGEQIDDRRWVFELREGIEFHSGNALRAIDVCWSLERAQRSSAYQAIKNLIASCEVLDEHRLEMAVVNPNSQALGHFALLDILDSAFYTGTDTRGGDKSSVDPGPDDWADHHASGSGPFKAVSRQPGQHRVYERFDRYWDRQPDANIDRIEYSFEVDAGKRVSGLQNDRYDVVELLPASYLAQIDSDPALRLAKMDSDRMLHFAIDQIRSPALADPEVRLALIQAINQAEIVRSVLHGVGRPTAQFSPPEYAGHLPALMPRHDLEAAVSTIRRKGLAGRLSLKMVAPNNRYLNDESIAITVAGMLRRLGLRVELETMPRAEYWPRIDERRDDLYLLGWSSDTGESSDYFASLLVCRDDTTGAGKFNLSGLCDPALDRRIDEAVETVDAGERRARLQALERWAYDNAVVIPLHHQSDAWAIRAEVDLESAALGNNYFAYERLRMEERP